MTTQILCPRCGDPFTRVLYGPCDICVADLREKAAIRDGFRHLVHMLCNKDAKATKSLRDKD